MPYDPSEGEVKISEDEIIYLIDAANEYFEKDIVRDDVEWTYAGVRPLYDDKSDDASAVTRDYVLNISEFSEGAPIMSVYGGKITTSRKLAEHAMRKLKDFYQYTTHDDWTDGQFFPGGDMPNSDFEAFYEASKANYPDVDAKILFRLCRAYGTKVSEVFANRPKDNRLGTIFGAGLSEAEVNYLVDKEFATRADDILWRRSKLGLHMSKTEADSFKAWFKGYNS